jgi:cytochrome c oxidase assembly protein subunit 15
MENRFVNPRYIKALRILLVMIVGLMALGAGVRVNNAGLSCPDWPLCYGKVIPDYHPVVWFEFVHRAYAGLVALFFLTCAIYTWRGKFRPAVKRAAAAGALFLLLQIAAGALTVLLLVKAVVVTIHLMLATCFFLSVLLMHEYASPGQPSQRPFPGALKVFAAVLPLGIFLQIALGGFVASTYAGSVCVDWPRCNGEWIPTLTGAIGLQIVHRFVAYTLAISILVFASFMHFKRNRDWMNPSLKAGTLAMLFVVFLQVAIGVANLLYFIPPSLAVIHQTVAILLLTISVKFFFVTRTA